MTGQSLVQLLAVAATFLEQATVSFMFVTQFMSAFSGYNVLISTMSPGEKVLSCLDFMRWGTQAQYDAAFRDNAHYYEDDLECDDDADLGDCRVDILHYYRYHEPRFWSSFGYLILFFALYATAQLPVLRYRTWATVLA